MSLSQLINALPGYAEDQKRNLATLAGESVLSEQQKWGCFLACAYAIGEPVVLGALHEEAQARLSSEAQDAARTVVAIMAMNAVYYRAVHQLPNHDYRKASVDLSMSALTHPGIDRIDFELWSLAVSAVDGCGVCLNAHEMELRGHDVPPDRVLAAIRIAAVVNAVSTIYKAEPALASKP
jgi:alkyl hydroperoxide reductase subunit D